MASKSSARGRAGVVAANGASGSGRDSHGRGASGAQSAGDPSTIVVPVSPDLKERLARIAKPVSDRLDQPVRRVTRFWNWVKALKPYRVYLNFSNNEGNLMAAGMSYQSLFASFAGIWLVFSIAGIWLRSAPQVEQALIMIINQAIPDLISHEGLIDPGRLPSGFTYGWTGFLAVIGLLWTAIAWLFYTRQAVRSMFGLGRDTTNYALQKIRDLGLALCFGVILVVSALISILSTEAANLVLSLLGFDETSFISLLTTRASGFVLSLALNLVVLASMFRLLSRVSIPFRNLVFGSFLGSVALSAVSVAGGVIVGAASRNPLLATFTVFIGLLIWFVLICRIMLLSASWIAVGMADRNISPRNLSPEQLAAERAAEERSARVIVAQAEVADALEQLKRSKWFGRLVAERRVERARNNLSDLLDQGVRGRR